MQAMSRQIRGLIVASVVLVVVVLAAVLIATPGTRVTGLTSSAPVEVGSRSASAFPTEEVSHRALLSSFEEVDDVIAEALHRAEAAVDAARRQAEQARADADGGTDATPPAGATSASARSSSSSKVDVSSSVSGGGSVSSSVSVSNSSSAVASAGGSTVVSGSSSSSVSSSQQGTSAGSSCVSEVITSTEVDGVVESSRQVSDSC